MTTAARLETRYWDDVSVGDEIDGFEVSLDETTMVEQVSGSQDWYQVHHNTGFARSSGLDEIFYNTGWTSSMIVRAITDWLGRDGWLRKYEFQMRKMNKNGDTVRVRGKVTGLAQTDKGNHTVDLEVWLENDREGVTTPATATVELPARASRA